MRRLPFVALAILSFPAYLVGGFLCGAYMWGVDFREEWRARS